MRSSIRFFSIASAVTAAAALTACGTYDPYPSNSYPVSQASYPYGSYPAGQPVAGVEYGRVTNVQLVSSGSGAARSGSPGGALIGGVVGGVVGNQIGHGGGRAAATILGALGGAAVGNEIGSRNNPPAYNTAGPVYRVTVQTEQGQMRTYDVSTTGDLRVGDRVRIENGVIYLA